jgi:hypothetical protein
MASQRPLALIPCARRWNRWKILGHFCAAGRFAFAVRFVVYKPLSPTAYGVYGVQSSIYSPSIALLQPVCQAPLECACHPLTSHYSGLQGPARRATVK